ncbi:ABC transporter ATP-binding protein [Streptomyces brasiliensis]|uniref:ABC transporter ATP-binding protein n=2 Tax=Streptomyces brasiliensis TaxID=1954 RepID=A0A917UL29_9ACTN|nr:ABC transporter ATP-binding protein [Streptomyces brasiliensis]
MARSLTLQDVSLRFGGISVLDGVSFTVNPGSIHAVIGPNGAGKSSCFNVISGLYRATAGSVHFGDVDLCRLAPHQIAAQGVGRAFQNIALAPHETVLDNLMVARHRLTRAGMISTALALPSARREAAAHRQRVEEIAIFVGLTDVLRAPAGTLSYGWRKKVELARALATEPDILMLDEPVAGMPAGEKMEIAALIRAIRDALGISVVLVEHDMPMVMSLADHITVLDFGRRIADGTPREVMADFHVIQAYLGTTDAPADELADALNQEVADRA